MDDSNLSHTRWKCQYHIVFIPKYRRKTLYGKVKKDVREILRTLCGYKKVEIVESASCSTMYFFIASSEISPTVET